MTSIVSIRQLTKTYGNGFQALKGVDLDIEEGEILALLGPNGAGKTTCFNLLTRFLPSSRGSIFFQGRDITRSLVADLGEPRKQTQPGRFVREVAGQSCDRQ